ncbi:MAG: MATE family efflux transporter, partial [Fuerstiella sp.]|nr:MATE family efflux transporter [Fuerstiella sp.]
LDVIAAVTPAAMLQWTVVCIPIGMVLYANTFISQFDGAGNTWQMAASLWQAVWLALIGGMVLVLLVPFSQALFLFAGHTRSVAGQEAAYFNTLCCGSALILVSSALSCFFSGRRRTSVVMCVNIVSLLINIVLDYAFVFGSWGMPELGITGAAIATLLARACDILMYSALIWWISRSGRFPFRATWKPSRDLMIKYLRFGLPSGLHYFVDNSGFLVFLFIVGSLNRDAMAATNLAFSVNSMIFVPLLGFGTAVQTLVGH